MIRGAPQITLRRLPRGGVDRNTHPSQQARSHKPVASHAEAWIETLLQSEPCRAGRSPPTRRRGSKLDHAVITDKPSRSPPTRRRGSKHPSRPPSPRLSGRLPRGGVDRNPMIRGAPQITLRRLPRGGVDRNTYMQAVNIITFQSPPTRRRGSKHTSRHTQPRMSGRLPRGGVDRNTYMQAVNIITFQVASHAEAWIETPFLPTARQSSHRRLPRGGVDRNLAMSSTCAVTWSSPPTRRRGSKLDSMTVKCPTVKSPPTRRRGSKPYGPVPSSPGTVSPPTRRRGSKPGGGDF